MSTLTKWTEDAIDYILAGNISKEMLTTMFETHRELSVLDHQLKEGAKVLEAWKTETAHGHGGNDNIPQPDPSAGMFAPMTRIGGEHGC